MAGKNISLLDIPPGVFRNSTRYATGLQWYDANQVRWENNILVPVGGWIKRISYTFAEYPIRKMFTWRDDVKVPWLAAGSADKLYVSSYIDGTYTTYDITPDSLGVNPGGLIGFGRDFFGSGEFGRDPPASISDTGGAWSMDNFGRSLVAVNSYDGRLIDWNPSTDLSPLVKAEPVLNAPVDNAVVVVTDERHCMVLGGNNNPRRVKWCSREALTVWTPAEDNSAGGLTLQSNGSIIAAVKVQGGVLVLTDTDIHIIEYIGPPDYYSRRRISDEGGIIGSHSITPLQGGAVWMDHTNVWSYVGGAVTKLPCSVQTELFKNSDLTVPQTVHLGINEEKQEVWFIYPGKSSNEPDRNVMLSYSQNPYWTLGNIPRTAWVNPVWQPRPLAANGTDVYEHEYGMLADGESREDIFIESGALEISEGDRDTWVTRIYPDFGSDAPGGPGSPDAIRLSFVLQQAPEAPKRLIGPLPLTNPKGYVRTRFRAKQMYMRIDQRTDEFWKLGKFRLQVKQGGAR